MTFWETMPGGGGPLTIAFVFVGVIVWLGLYVIIAKFCGAIDLIEPLLKVLKFSFMFAVCCASLGFGESFFQPGILLSIILLILGLGILVLFIYTIIFGIKIIPCLLYITFAGIPSMPLALKNSGLNLFLACIIGFPLGIIAALPCSLIITVIVTLFASLLHRVVEILPLFFIIAACGGGISVIIIILK